MTLRRSIENVYSLISGDEEDARVCKDISEAHCRVVPGNFFLQLLASTLSKVGDRLADPKLVLTWLMGSLGSPVWMIGWLVPIRQAGALLPQLALAGLLRAQPLRKWFWIAGSAAQGICVGLMGLAALRLDGVVAGATVLVLLAAFSMARSINSVTSKDLLGKTVPRTRRGRLNGLAASMAGLVTLGVGIFLSSIQPGDWPTSRLALILLVAAGMWLFAASIMSLLQESPGATSGGGSALREGVSGLRMLATERPLRNFVLARALLASTVLSMPFYVRIASDATDARISGLGVLLIAAASATSLSATAWGWMADRSSRHAMAIAGICASLVGIGTWVVSGLGISDALAIPVYASLYFLLNVMHTGIRVGRKTYLVDLAPSEKRPLYVAVSNTVIGVVLLASGSLGALAPALGDRGIVLLFALLGLSGGALVWALPEA